MIIFFKNRKKIPLPTGLLGGWQNVQWSLMKNVVLAWMLTLPATGLISFILVRFMMVLDIGLVD